jgi:hypothetical protein
MICTRRSTSSMIRVILGLTPFLPALTSWENGAKFMRDRIGKTLAAITRNPGYYGGWPRVQDSLFEARHPKDAAEMPFRRVRGYRPTVKGKRTVIVTDPKKVRGKSIDSAEQTRDCLKGDT